MTDHGVHISDEVILQLRAYLAEPKFREDDFGYFQGSEPVRQEAELLLHDFVERLIKLGPGASSKKQVLCELKVTLTAFNDFDSEEQDKLMRHLDPLLDLLGIESTDGLIGNWRYGISGVW